MNNQECKCHDCTQYRADPSGLMRGLKRQADYVELQLLNIKLEQVEQNLEVMKLRNGLDVLPLIEESLKILRGTQ